MKKYNSYEWSQRVSMRSILYVLCALGTCLIIIGIATTQVSAQPSSYSYDGEGGYEIWGSEEPALPEVWYEKPEDDTVNYGVIKHYNQATYSPSTEPEIISMETPYGTISISLDRTNNAACNPLCPDTASIYSLPEGVIALPPQITTQENTFGEIILYPYRGS